jgi:hypothetical protein
MRSATNNPGHILARNSLFPRNSQLLSRNWRFCLATSFFPLATRHMTQRDTLMQLTNMISTFRLQGTKELKLTRFLHTMNH